MVPAGEKLAERLNAIEFKEPAIKLVKTLLRKRYRMRHKSNQT